MANIDWSTVNEAAEFEQIPADGYICKITSVKDVEDKEYYNVEFDIAEGPFKDYFLDASERSGYWFANFVKSYKPKARPFFKGMLTAIEHSNKGFFADKFDNDPQKLVGKQIGLVIGIEEYFTKGGVVVIEWSETIKDILPKERLDIKFKILDENKRLLILKPYGKKYEDLCEAVL